MKNKPQPATVHDIDENGNAILRSKRSATRITKPAPNSSSPRNLKKADFDTMPAAKSPGGRSICQGTIEQMMKVYYERNSRDTLTIFSRSQDQSEERNEVPGYQFRKIFFRDDTEVVNPDAILERRKSVRLTVFIPRREETHPDPRLYVEQRVFEGVDEKILIHELLFEGQLKLGFEYVFPGCGDEDARLGKRDLRLSIQSLEQENFNHYITNCAQYYGYNRTEYALVNKYALSNGLTYTLKSPGNGDIRPYKVTFDRHDLQTLLEAKQRKDNLSSTNNRDTSSMGLEFLKLRLHGFGGLSKDGQQAGYLDLCLVYNP